MGEVSNEEIVKGYEYDKGQYVIIQDDEIDKLRTESDKSIRIDGFVTPDAVSSIYFGGRTYYLTPDGPVGQKPYNLLMKGMADQRRGRNGGGGHLPRRNRWCSCGPWTGCWP